MDELISIIIPVYNVKKYVRESIESAINQTYKKIEIIIIDDGSNDGSEKICDEYAKKDSRIKLIHQKNKGLSAARNKGLDAIQGKYVAFLDSDDVFHPEMIKKSYETLIKNKADCVICNYGVEQKNEKLSLDKIYKLKKRMNISSNIYTKNQILKLILAGNISIVVWNKLYKKELFDNIRFPEGHVHEDRIVTLQVFEKCRKTYVLDEKLMIYRIHNKSIGHTYTTKNIEDLNLACISCEQRIKKNLSGVYDETDYYKICNRSLINYILVYVKNEISGTTEKKETRKLLKGYIAESKSKVNLKYFTKKQRIIYELYNKCSFLLVIAYKLYTLIA